MKTKRASAAFFLMLFIFESFWPTAAMALTDGYQQAEFGSYEDFGSTDMVNIMTGDFTYNLPLLNVPSPEGGFQIPLSYHAGIQMDEESSWVGLGWGLNPGVLNRNVSVNPDDYDGGENTETYVNAPSQSSNGYVESGIFRTNTYDSNIGSSTTWKLGNVASVSTSDANGIGASLLGISYDQKNALSYDAAQSILGVYEVAMAALSFGAVGGAGALFATGVGIAQSVGQISAAAKSTREGTSGFKNTISTTYETEKTGLFKNTVKYSRFLRGTATNRVQGSLYLGNYDIDTNPFQIPTQSTAQLVFNNSWGSGINANRPYVMGVGAARLRQDIYVLKEDKVPLSNQFNPISIGYDNFSVSAGGISGAITPFRLEAGSLADPIYADQNVTHLCFALTPFIKNKSKWTYQNNFANYKVPLMYSGEASNRYTHPINFGGNNQPLTSYTTDWDYQSSNYFQVTLNNTNVYNNDLGSGRVSREPNRLDNSLLDDQLTHGKHIEWFSNWEISTRLSASAYNGRAQALMDCGINRSTFPESGIGGFCISREDGLTYHFTIPVYNKTEYQKIKKGNASAADWYTISNMNPYASKWLLTGITGPDFVDRGTIGQIDDSDWGYWVKFDYGMYNNNFLWRSPYFGWDVLSNGYQSFSKGFKETYYLNTIRTRSHTAIFAKDVKKDGRSYYETNGDGKENVTTGEPADPTPNIVSKSLKLDDVYLLKNEDYDHLKSTLVPKWNFNINNSTNWAWPWDWNNPTTWQINNNNANIIQSNPSNINAYGDISPAVANYLKDHQLQRIHFNYTYELCPATQNSWDENETVQTRPYNAWNIGYNFSLNRTGKLTLKSVEMFGRNDARIMPSYEFDYDLTNSNPSYSMFKKDENGFYKPEPVLGSNANQRNPGPEGDQWSLKKITSPLGSVMEINYERDTYSNVNGYNYLAMPMKVPGINISQNIVAHRIYTNPNFGNVNKFIKVNTVGYITCDPYPTSFLPLVIVPSQGINFVVSAVDVNGTYFDFTSNDPNLSTLCSQIAANPLHDSAKIGVFTGGSAANPKYGGELRVNSIVTTDELGNKYVTKYEYNNSGVASFELTSQRTQEFEFYKNFDHPYTPIIYGNVTVSNGRMNGNTFETNGISTYKFTTPHVNMLSVNKGIGTSLNQTGFNENHDQGAYYAKYTNGTKNVSNYAVSARTGHIIITDNTASIGNVEEVTSYNSRNEAIQQTKYTYGMGENGMGVYGQTNFLFEYFRETYPSVSNNYMYRLFQTTKLKNNICLKSVSTNVRGISSVMEIESHEPLSGLPRSVVTTVGGGSGEKYKTEYVYAHEKYPWMGSKVGQLNVFRPNMMSQITQQKELVYVANNQGGGAYKILSSQVTTWNGYQNRRQFNPTTQKYVTAAPNYAVNKPFKEYIWKSSVDKDGTIDPTNGYVEFSWTANPDARWIKTSEATIYSQHSRLLEGLDVNNRKITSKYSANEYYPIATVFGCDYGEWCFSSAEDPGKGAESNFFGGEVQETQYRSRDLAHTGNYSLKTIGGQFAGAGFHFKGDFGTSSAFKPGKKYRASVWIHESNLNGQLYCELHSSTSINSLAFVMITPGSVKEKYGSWYLLNLDVTLPTSIGGSNPLVVFGCYNNGASASEIVFFDDFRVRPIGAAFTANVTDMKTGNVVATLDAENLATRYTYNDAGRIVKTEVETRNGFVTASTKSYNYKR